MASSDQVVIDLSNYKDKVGSRVPEGSYRVVVEDVESGISAAGNQMINLWFRIVGGEHDGSTLIDRLVLTEKSLFRVVGFMQAIGLPTPKRRLQVNVRSWVGKQLMVDVEDGEPYNGRVKSEVRSFLRASAAAAAAVMAAPAETEAANTDNAALNDLAGLSAFSEEADEVVSAEGTLEEVDLDSLNL